MRTDPLPASPRSRADAHPAGTVRSTDVGWFETALDDAISCTTGDLTLDLRDVEFMDASGIAVLCDRAERLRAAGRELVLTGPGYVVERAIDARLPAGHVRIYRS